MNRLRAVLAWLRYTRGYCRECSNFRYRDSELCYTHLQLQYYKEVVAELRKPCRGENSNVCVAEGCYDKACLTDK